MQKSVIRILYKCKLLCQGGCILCALHKGCWTSVCDYDVHYD